MHLPVDPARAGAPTASGQGLRLNRVSLRGGTLRFPTPRPERPAGGPPGPQRSCRDGREECGRRGVTGFRPTCGGGRRVDGGWTAARCTAQRRLSSICRPFAGEIRACPGTCHVSSPVPSLEPVAAPGGRPGGRVVRRRGGARRVAGGRPRRGARPLPQRHRGPRPRGAVGGAGRWGRLVDRRAAPPRDRAPGPRGADGARRAGAALRSGGGRPGARRRRLAPRQPAGGGGPGADPSARPGRGAGLRRRGPRRGDVGAGPAHGGRARGPAASGRAAGRGRRRPARRRALALRDVGRQAAAGSSAGS